MRAAVKIIVGLVVVVGLVVYCFLNKVTDAYRPTYNRVELVSNDNNKLYIKSKNWGVTGDHQLTVISAEDKSEFEI